jgi:hypothetical protein
MRGDTRRRLGASAFLNGTGSRLLAAIDASSDCAAAQTAVVINLTRALKVYTIVLAVIGSYKLAENRLEASMYATDRLVLERIAQQVILPDVVEELVARAVKAASADGRNRRQTICAASWPPQHRHKNRHRDVMALPILGQRKMAEP